MNLEKESNLNSFLFTSESVTQGHPDKLCDYISDSILDECLQQDPDSKVACESCTKGNICMVFGEITTKAKFSYQDVVKNAIKEVGYTSQDLGFDYNSAQYIFALDKQSPEINQALKCTKLPEDIGAGDQGLMIGYATNETEEYMPLTHVLASNLCLKLKELRENNILPWLGPDGKSQVTIEYTKDEKSKFIKPQRVHTILISTQHSKEVSNEEIRSQLKKHLIQAVIPQKFYDENTIVHINPSDRFVIGGPAADSGLTGRKIIVDTYGGWGSHGGGCFSGKDSTKVDRSGAYAARWVAKSMVANGFCQRCTVQIAYGIGIAEPISLYVDTYGTVSAPYSEKDLQKIAIENFDLRPGCLIRDLKLNRPIFKKTAAFGHFGRNDSDFSWEKIKDLSHTKQKLSSVEI